VLDLQDGLTHIFLLFAHGTHELLSGPWKRLQLPEGVFDQLGKQDR